MTTQTKSMPASASLETLRAPLPGCQLYLISPPIMTTDFGETLRSVLSVAPAAAFQFRVKGMEQNAAAQLAEPLRKICADMDTAFIVNDSIVLAKLLGADGVHLGQEDGDPREARDVLGRDAQIGMTCHNSRHLAMEAGEANVDYVAFGSFYDTGTKQVQHYADMDILTWWSGLFEIPCVAIGGITVQNAVPVIAAGADFIAVSGAVWNDPKGAAHAAAGFAQLLGLD